MKKFVTLFAILLATAGLLCAQVPQNNNLKQLSGNTNTDSCQLIQKIDSLEEIQEVEIVPVTCPSFVDCEYNDLNGVFYATMRDTLGAGPDVFGFFVYLSGEDAYGQEVLIYKGYVSNESSEEIVSFTEWSGDPAVVTNPANFNPYLYAAPGESIELVPYMFYTGDDCSDTIWGYKIPYTLPDVTCPSLGNVTITPQTDGSYLLRTPVLNYQSELVDSTSFQYRILYPDASWTTENAVLSDSALTLAFVPEHNAAGDFKFTVSMSLAGLCTLDGNVTLYSDTVDYTIILCPDFDGSVFVVSSADGLRDTLVVGIVNYDPELVRDVVVTIETADQENVITIGTMHVNEAGTFADYDIGDWGDNNLLSQYGLTPGDTLTYVVVVTMEMEDGVECQAVVQNSVTIGVPACPGFNRQGATVTTHFTAEDRSIVVTYPVENYLTSLLYNGNGSFRLKWYKDGVYQGVIPAMYHANGQYISATLPMSNIAQGRRYDFAPTMKLVHYCNPGSTAFQVVEGDTVGVVFPVLCTSYGSATVAALNGNGSITVTHQLVNYDADLIDNTATQQFYIYVDGVQKTSYQSQMIDNNGVMQAVIPASDLQTLSAAYTFEGKTLTFAPQVTLLDYCDDLGTGPVSNGICYPYSTTPGFVANSTNLILDESNNSAAMSVGVNGYASGRVASYLFKYCVGDCSQGYESWGTVIPVWNSDHSSYSATQTFNYLGQTLKVVPYMVIDNGCVGFDTLYGALAQVEIPLCPEYGDTTVAVLRSDGSIKVSHLIANYNAALVQASSKFNMYVQGESTPTELSANVSAEGLMTVVLPDSIVSTLVGKILTFTPVLSLLNGCDNYLSAAPTAEICVPLPADMKPSFSGVTNTDGLGKMNLFPNNGVIVKAKILNYDSAFTKKTGFLISREAITAYNPDLYQEVAVVPSGETGDSIVYTVGIDSCGGFTHYCPFVILDCCDSVVLGTDHSFEMWAPSLDTVSADPYTIAANGTVMLKAVATMEVASWPTVAGSYTAFMPYAAGMCSSMTECVDDTSCAVYCSNLPNASDAVLQPMENWMTLLVAVRNCCVTWSMVKTSIMNSFGIDPADAIFKYVWEANGSEIYQSGTSGTTYVQPATTTNYTAKAIFTYNNTSCVVKDTVTVTVNP